MDCLFCRIAAKEIPATVVFEDEHMLAFRDINPQAPTHLLIIPREHVASLSEADGRHEAMLGRLLLTAAQLARKEGIEAQGYRTVLNTGRGAGQSVFHVHVHLLGGRPLAWPPG